MTGKNTQDLSASLEDYLEAILNISENRPAVRSTDIAEMLNVTRASVTGALRQLADKRLVNYTPYGQATLTKTGLAQAQRVAAKHNIIKSFFVDVLGVDPDTAQRAACKAEHALGPKVITRLLHFIEFATRQNKDGNDLIEEFRRFCKDLPSGTDLTRKPTPGPKRSNTVTGAPAIPLSKVGSGESVTVVKIEANRELHSRLASMGLLAGVKVTVAKNNPTGPFVIKVRGSKMMLGRNVTHNIMVKKIEE